MKQLLKKVIARALYWQVRRLRTRNTFKIVAVCGSIGKTSTKFAIAQLLSSKYRVRFQAGNYNDFITVPLVFFGLPLPNIMNPVAWLMTFLRIEQQLRRPYNYDVVVLELGTDGPGQIAHDFKPYIHADIGIVTAITPEHMEFFGTLDAVATEELTLGEFSDTLVINSDLCPAQFRPQHEQLVTYGTEGDVQYKLQDMRLDANGYSFAITKDADSLLSAQHPSIAKSQLYSLTAAAAVADHLGMSSGEIKAGFELVKPVSGRMQLLKGKRGMTIIDETYNASPEAMIAALRTLYGMPGSQKIALLGNMNELGSEFSPGAHTDIGALCDPAKLAYVVTLGPDANEYLAPAAEKAGCQVQRCDSPYAAASFIETIMENNAILLAKGSQNRVFAEEAVKLLLDNPSDSAKLVRQSAHWLGVKRTQFRDFPE